MKKENTKELAKKRLVKTLKKDRALTRSSKVIAKAMIATGMFSMISCGVILPGGGAMTFATTDAIEAQGRNNIGVIEQVKADKDKKTAYWQNEHLREVAHYTKPNWLEKKLTEAKTYFNGNKEAQ